MFDIESSARPTFAGPAALLERAYIDAVNNSEEAGATRTRILDAAYERFCRRGVQRSSMEDVARGAGLSRITVYRHFATKDDLIEQVLLREFRRYFDRFLIDIKTAATVAERVVLGFVSSLRAIRGNALIGGLISAEPDMIAGSMMGDDGRMLGTVRHFLAGQLLKEQRAGHISMGLDTDLVAELMVRVSASFLTIPSHILDLDDDQQLSSIAWQFLVPMLDEAAGRREGY